MLATWSGNSDLLHDNSLLLHDGVNMLYPKGHRENSLLSCVKGYKGRKNARDYYMIRFSSTLMLAAMQSCVKWLFFVNVVNIFIENLILFVGTSSRKCRLTLWLSGNNRFSSFFKFFFAKRIFVNKNQCIPKCLSYVSAVDVFHNFACLHCIWECTYVGFFPRTIVL